MTDTPMSHEDAQELLAALVLDSLDQAEADRVLGHAENCAACSAELNELRVAAAAVALSAPPSANNAARASKVRGRLLKRASASKDAMLELTALQTRRPLGMDRFMAAAAAVLIVGAAGFYAAKVQMRSYSGQLESQLAELNQRYTASSRAADSLRLAVSARDSMIAGFTGHDMSLVRLTSNAKREAWALMFWNRATNGWTFVAHNLPQPAAGRTYQLWLVTADKKISAGTFAPGADGDAVVRAVYALNRDALKAVAVTDEPAGGVTQPTGAFVVIGSEH